MLVGRWDVKVDFINVHVCPSQTNHGWLVLSSTNHKYEHMRRGYWLIFNVKLMYLLPHGSWYLDNIKKSTVWKYFCWHFLCCICKKMCKVKCISFRVDEPSLKKLLTLIYQPLWNEMAWNAFVPSLHLSGKNVEDSKKTLTVIYKVTSILIL